MIQMKNCCTALMLMLFVVLDQAFAQKIYGGSQSEWGAAVFWVDDEKYVVGSTDEFGSAESDILVIKTDNEGEIIWSKCYGGASEDFAVRAILTKDSAILIGGGTRSFGVEKTDFYLLKIDLDGDVLWEKTIGGDAHETLNYIVNGKENNYFFGGFGRSNDSRDYWPGVIGNISADGEILWYKSVIDIHRDVLCRDAVATKDGGCVVIGFMLKVPSGSEGLYLKFDSTGTVEWTEVAKSISCVGIQEGQNGDFIVAGEFGGRTVLQRIDSLGWILESREFNRAFAPQYLEKKDSNTFVVLSRAAGVSVTNRWATVMEFDASLHIKRTRRYRFRSDPEIEIRSIFPKRNGGYSVAVNHPAENGNSDILVFEVDSVGEGGCLEADDLKFTFGLSQSSREPRFEFDSNYVEGSVSSTVWNCSVPSSNYCYPSSIAENGTVELNVFPNPVTDKLIVEGLNSAQIILQIVTVDGRLKDELHLSGDSFEIDLSAYPTGIYVVRLIGKTLSQQTRVVKI